MDEPILMKIFEHLLSRDRRLQRETVEEYFTEDIEFDHVLGKVKGRDGYYGELLCMHVFSPAVAKAW